MAMTFKEKFKAKRKKLGPGQVFRWKGKSYSTNIKSEGYKRSTTSKSKAKKTIKTNKKLMKTTAKKTTAKKTKPIKHKAVKKYQKGVRKKYNKRVKTEIRTKKKATVKKAKTLLPVKSYVKDRVLVKGAQKKKARIQKASDRGNMKVNKKITKINKRKKYDGGYSNPKYGPKVKKIQNRLWGKARKKRAKLTRKAKFNPNYGKKVKK